MKSEYIEWPGLGRALLVRNPRARRISARWLAPGELRLCVPVRATVAQIAAAMEQLAPRLLSRAPQPAATPCRPGTVIETTGLKITVESSPQAPPGGVALRGTIAQATLLIHPDADAASIAVARGITRLLMRLASHRAPDVLRPMARATAGRLGVQPRQWAIGRGLRTLGTCSPSGTVTLSAALMFLPDELREYIVCHELAHLTHMNHSARFHALCDRYCGGREAALSAALKAFRWPIPR